jgi:hypothetical protein
MSKQFQIVKKAAALQISYIPVTTKEAEYGKQVEKEGAVYLQFAKSTGAKNDGGHNTFDWKNKIVFAVGINDIFQLITFYNGILHNWSDTTQRQTLNLIHVPPGASEDNVKKLTIQSGVDKYLGTYMLTMRNEAGDSINVSMTAGEMDIFINFCRTASVYMTGLHLDLQREREVR